MPNTLYLLDGMALVYRAHFALIRRPIFTSKGVNTSALYGFTNTLLDLLATHQPTHIAVAFDTEAPTQRHEAFPSYKAQREEMPEDLSVAIPHVFRMIEAFNIPVLKRDGFEADDIIGTLARRAARDGFTCYMVTPDKDFGQLVDERVFIIKPSRGGEAMETLGVGEVRARWGIERPSQVIDVLALMGDASDNIPGVPGVGEKTAIKLIAQYGTLEQLLEHTGELKGKQKEVLEANQEQARLCKRLATIDCEVPIAVAWDDLALKPRREEALRALCVEFEFNALGRRLFGDAFHAGRGFAAGGQGELFSEAPPSPAPEAMLQADKAGNATAPEPSALADPNLKTIRTVPHEYRLIVTAAERDEVIAALMREKSFCFDTETTGLDPKDAKLLGVAFSWKAGTGHYMALPAGGRERTAWLMALARVMEGEGVEKVGHNLKFDLSVLQAHGVGVAGPYFDTMIAHSLTEPDQRHGMDYLSAVYLGYRPVAIAELIGDKKSGQKPMEEVPVEALSEYAAEDADVTWQLRGSMAPLLKAKGQERVFYEIEGPLLPVLAAMESEGVRVDARTLAEFSESLAKQMAQCEARVQRLAGEPFNLNSPKQLGEVLFDRLKIGSRAKKTRTGQYATDEQTLAALAGEHEIVRAVLEYRTVSKLKSTYADTLPQAIHPVTGRVHTTFHQALTSTGRLASQNPNLQNIPIRTELGQEVRKAFVPRDERHLLLSADYSQIELRVIAALSGDAGMREAFAQRHDIHAATAARVYGLPIGDVTSEMRRQAKMVNFGIIYGISAFGLAQRLGIPRQDAAALIEQYFKQYPAIQAYISFTIESARRNGYVETVTGRRRYLRDINSANATIRGAAERTAINTPIQGTAADMIKIAMVAIHRELNRQKLKTRMILQVHDELVFDLVKSEEAAVRLLVAEGMTRAIPLDVPIEVEMGAGVNWLEAH